MRVILAEGTVKEIADLVFALQGPQNPDVTLKVDGTEITRAVFGAIRGKTGDSAC